MVDVFLSCDKRRFGKTFVVARDFNLLAVLGHFLEVVVVRSEFLKFLLEVALHLLGYLVCALGNDAHGFVDVVDAGQAVYEYIV